jgi:putative ABC transport system substrate-binding protein
VTGAGLRRRDLFALASSATAAKLLAPSAAHAQNSGKLPTIGFLGAATPTIWSAFVAAFLQRMRELGWIDGSNVKIEYRWAEGRQDRYAAFAAEFAQQKVDVIVTAGTPAVIATMKATSTIPIVFAAAGDPVETKLVSSLARPGGNVTGLSNQQTDLGGRKLELLGEVVPGFKRVAIMGNVNSPIITLEMKSVAAAAAKLGLEAVRLEIHKTEDIIPGIEGLKGRVDGLYICSDPLITTHRARINTLATSMKLPTMNAFREYVEAGGLMSYGPNFPDLFRRSGDYVDKILRGAKPGDIPVEQPVKFDLIVNNNTAKALGLTIPETFLVRANEVIE